MVGEFNDYPLLYTILLHTPRELLPTLIRAAGGAAALRDAHDARGDTFLMRAAWGLHPRVVAALLQAGAADVAAVDRTGSTALHYAAQVYTGTGRAVECCALLLCAGAPLAAQSWGWRKTTPLAGAVWREEGRQIAVLLAFDSPLPPMGEDTGLPWSGPAGAARIRAALPEAVAVAKSHLAVLDPAAAETHATAAAVVEGLLLAAAGACCPFSRLRALRSGSGAVPPWEEAWRRHAPFEHLMLRFGGAVYRLAWARAMLSCAARAEAAAAERAVSVLRQLGDASAQQQQQQPAAVSSPSSQQHRQREKLTYAAACCVAKWWEVKQAGAQSQRELQAAEQGAAVARARGEATVARLQAMLQQGEGCCCWPALSSAAGR